MTMFQTVQNTPFARTAVCAAALTAAFAAPVALAQPLAAPAPFSVAEPTLEIKRYLIDGVNPIPAADTAKLLAPYTGERQALGQIEQAAMALEKALKAEGFVFHRVFVPVQKPKDGEVTLQIIQFTIDKVAVTGNEHYNTGNIRRSMPTLVEGSVPDIREIGSDLTAANANPGKHVTVTFKESAKPDSVDAAVKVKDSPPLTYFVGYTANVPTASKTPDDGITRLTAGFQHANLFDRDHVASLSYTTDPGNIGKVSLIGVYYQFPIYGEGLNLSAYYTSSDINSGAAAPGGPDVTGKGRFLGVRLAKSLPRTGPLSQTVSVALDDRLFESNLPNAIPGLPDQNVGSRALSARYAFRRDEPWGGFGGSLDYVFNLESGGANSAVNYANQIAAPADHKWQAWRFGLEGTYRDDRWTYTGRLRGQVSSNSLISGEKFSLGGANSVRGFSDARVRGDSGYLWNFEALGPEMWAPQLRPILFLDGGQVRSNGLLSGVSEDLASLGAGLRWSYQKFDFSADLSYVLRADSAETQSHPVRLNISAFYRF
jgi:hemolysin activation/secretion protein